MSFSDEIEKIMEIGRKCNQAARQIFIDQPNLLPEDLIGRPEIEHACDYNTIDKATLMSYIHPNLSANEETAEYQDLSVWKVEDAVALWFDMNPLIFNLAEHNPDYWYKSYATDLRMNVTRLFNKAEADIISKKLDATKDEKTYYVNPQVFYDWAIKIDKKGPRGDAPVALFKAILSKRANTTQTRPQENKIQDNEKPWFIHDERDPIPKQPWYTAARYFARQLLSSNPNLRKRRDLLAQETAKKLKKEEIYKRGNSAPPNPSTILKAFSNVDFS